MESQERLSKLSRFVASLDPKAQVKDSWHILCSCGTTVKLNHEYGVARYQEHDTSDVGYIKVNLE